MSLSNVWLSALSLRYAAIIRSLNEVDVGFRRRGLLMNRKAIHCAAGFARAAKWPPTNSFARASTGYATRRATSVAAEVAGHQVRGRNPELHQPGAVRWWNQMVMPGQRHPQHRR